ncbi:MAG: aminoacyl-tRNA hydrolase [Elusimicrobia bacterium]|nr:aminoacyl-tRNA hydrolase [Elusimicrobiota bacterium]
MATEIKLIVGLGNPDARYEKTRHNVGFSVADLLAQEAGVAWVAAKAGIKARITSLPGGQRVLKPLEYMNNSGIAVRAIADYYHIAPAEILVMVDDFSLLMGVLRVRTSGSAGGHNGLKSIIEQLGTVEFPRLRCGIGPVPPNEDPADFVLSTFTSQESAAAADMIQRAGVMVRDILAGGIAATTGKGLN